MPDRKCFHHAALSASSPLIDELDTSDTQAPRTDTIQRAIVSSDCRQSCGSSATTSPREGRRGQHELDGVGHLHGNDRAGRQSCFDRRAAMDEIA